MTDRPLTSKRNAANAAPAPEPHRAETASSPRFKVSELLGGAREAILEHGGEEYRLRITANRKLILTK
jgi:hemin uptake protein HemP